VIDLHANFAMRSLTTMPPFDNTRPGYTVQSACKRRPPSSTGNFMVQTACQPAVAVATSLCAGPNCRSTLKRITARVVVCRLLQSRKPSHPFFS